MEDPSTDEVTKKWVSASACKQSIMFRLNFPAIGMQIGISLSDGAGVDTTLALMTRFIINMIIHPDIQRRVQEEIDEVTGGHRLPGLEE